MAVSYSRAVVADLVPDTRAAEAFPRDISLPAGGGTACRRLCRLGYRAYCFNFGIPES